MSRADVVVIGAGLAGLSCAVELAERGVRVLLVAKGMATTHWTHGGLDVAAPPGAATPREGVSRLARDEGHPYAGVAPDLADAVDAHLVRMANASLPYSGALDAPLVPIPTAIGTHRSAAILPAAQAAALEPWADDGLLLVDYARYRDGWAHFAARNLAGVDWPNGPREVRAVTVELPGADELHNLNPRSLSLLFDRGEWRARALRAVAAAVPRQGRWRVGLPATLGFSDHAAVLADATETLGHPVIEMPSLPPSPPGIRVYEALRSTLLAAGGRIQVGFGVNEVERDGSRILAVRTDGAARTLRIGGDAFVLATGGIGGEGIRAMRDGALVERVFGLPVAAPPRATWFSDDPLLPHPIETAGIRTDDELRPIGPDGQPVLQNVHVVGSGLAGMRYLAERCGDGVALASAHRAARLLVEGRRAAA